MKTKYVPSMVVAATGIAAVAWAIVSTDSGFGLVVAGAGFPVAILLAVRTRLDGRVSGASIIGGAVVGVISAFAGYGIVFGFAYAFVLGFAGEASTLFEALGVDPRFSVLLESPWVLVLIAEVVIVAPLTEEFGKAVGARWHKPESRLDAFLAGVGAGAGFAVIENLLYASGGAWAGGPWTDILLGRMPGAAVHPLACGLVVLGWWEWRHEERRGTGLRLILSGVATHALWNGSIVVLVMVEWAYELGSTPDAFRGIALAYIAAMGAVTAAVLWRFTSRLSSTESRPPGGMRDGRVVAVWATVCSSLLVPIGLAILAFPDFYRG